MASEKFRHQLRKEVEQWQAEGIIDGNTYQQLANRYQFDDLDTASHNRFVAILLGLGSILLGLAVITFVAANWQAWSRELKVILLLSLFVGVNAGGFYLWQHSSQRWQSRLGQALLLLGGLILGANMALMSQMFHQSGAVYQLYLVWSFGVLVMAYSLRLTALGTLALILAAIAYCLGLPHLFRLEGVSTLELVLKHMPLLVSALFIPLAYWCRSRWLFGLGAVLIVFALETNLLRSLVDLDGAKPLVGIMAAIAFSIPPALLWAYRDSLWGLHQAYFDSIARNLAVFFLALGLYSFSFHTFWLSPVSTVRESEVDLSVLLDALVLGSIALFAWWRLGYAPGARSFWQIDFTSTSVGLIIATAAFLFWWHWSVSPLGAIAVVIFNAFLAILAIALVRKALSTGTRRGFWAGILLLVLQLLSRMLEYNTGLLFKAIVLFLCGVAILAAGLWFERYLGSHRPPMLADQHRSNS